MTFWIGGKYPHLGSAAGNFCGSTEFFAGPKNFPVEYRHIDMYKNYEGMNVRLHYGDQDFIRGYHQDMNRVWTEVMDNYEYKKFTEDIQQKAVELADTRQAKNELMQIIQDNMAKNPAKLVERDDKGLFTAKDPE